MKENNWCKILNYSNEKLDYKGVNFFGYAYIDHEAGLTIEVIKFFKFENNSIKVTEDLIDLNERTFFRYNALLNNAEIEVLIESEIEAYELKVPDYLKHYNKPTLEVFRKQEVFDGLRAPGYPDDVMVLLPPVNNMTPEQVWVKVKEYYPKEQMVKGVLLNQPNQNFGLKKNDIVNASLALIEEEIFLIADIDVDKIVKKKKWWQF